MTTDPNTVPKRRYTAAEVSELIELLSASEDFAPLEIKGMERLGKLLEHYESMSDADIAAEARRHFRSATNQSP